MERKKWKQEKDTIVSVSSRHGPPKLQSRGRHGKKKRRKKERTSRRRRMGNAGLNLLSRADGQEDGSWASLSLQMSRILKTHITSCQEKAFLPLSSTHPLLIHTLVFSFFSPPTLINIIVPSASPRTHSSFAFKPAFSLGSTVSKNSLHSIQKELAAS